MKDGKPKRVPQRVRRHYRLPAFLIAQLTARRLELQVTETRIVEDALRAYFAKP